MSIHTQYDNQHTYASKIGKYVQYQRKKRKISINQFANRIGVTPSFLSRLEKGEYDSIKLSMVEKMAYGLKMSLIDLLKKIGINSDKSKLPEIDFYLREKYQFPKEAIDDVKLMIELVKKKYKSQIKQQKVDHKKYWNQKYSTNQLEVQLNNE